MENNSELKYKPYSSKGSGPVFLVIILILSLIIMGIYYGNKYFQESQKKSDLLLTATLIEGRHKQIGPFFSLYAWFGIFNKVENFYYQRYHEYTRPDGLSTQLISAIDPSIVLNNIRTDFWVRGYFLDSFIPYDSLKNTLNNKYGKNFRQFLTGFDSTTFKYDFRLKKNKMGYTIKVFELKDINFDDDTNDYFIFKCNKKKSQVKFVDKDNKFNEEFFIMHYSLKFSNLQSNQ